MTLENILLVCVGITAVTVLTCFCLTVALLRRLTPSEPREVGNFSAGRTGLKSNRSGVAAIPSQNVIQRLSFLESVDPERFAVASQEVAEANVRQSLSQIGDGVSITLNSIQLLKSGAEMTVSVSRNGQILLAKGIAAYRHEASSGLRLTSIANKSTGKILEQMKEVPYARALTRSAALSTAVVGAAHLIASADIAKQLKSISSQLDQLLAYRRIDQAAKLERIYSSAKELVSAPMTQEKSWELWRLRGELRELRCAWRRELEHHFSRIEEPKEFSWLHQMFGYEKASDGKLHRSITEAELQLGLIEYSMRLDHVLAVIGGTDREFGVTLVDEVCAYDRLEQQVRGKSKFISGKYPELSVEPMLNGMGAFVEQYKGLSSRITSSASQHVSGTIAAIEQDVTTERPAPLEFGENSHDR